MYEPFINMTFKLKLIITQDTFTDIYHYLYFVDDWEADLDNK